MHILIVSATGFEIAPMLSHLETHYDNSSFFAFTSAKHTIYPLVTGIGAVNMAIAMSRFSHMKDIDVAINAGVAGTFDNDLALGSLVEVHKDRFADLGVEEADCSFTDVYEMQLCGADDFPFKGGWLINDKAPLSFSLPQKTGLTVNKVHGSQSSIDRVQQKYHADVESMEGAAFLYTCKLMDVKCHQLRALSNRVEPRNRANWQLDKAISNLNAFLIETLSAL
ncbi:MAG: futalosine hydrolase [Saprospiraceae bacterium]|nr:futalosine hydrolase [Saprospiraceae bacterium]